MTQHPFFALHRHRMIRVAAATPRATVGDTIANAEAASPWPPARMRKVATSSSIPS